MHTDRLENTSNLSFWVFQTRSAIAIVVGMISVVIPFPVLVLGANAIDSMFHVWAGLFVLGGIGMLCSPFSELSKSRNLKLLNVLALFTTVFVPLLVLSNNPGGLMLLNVIGVSFVMISVIQAFFILRSMR